MNRIVLVVVTALVIPVLAAGVWWSLGTCRFLDRLLGATSCVSTATIADFEPLRGNGFMATPTQASGGNAGRMFGFDLRDGSRRPAMIQLDIESGEELGRVALSVRDSFEAVILARDRQRAMLVCDAGAYCALDQDRDGVIVALETAAVLELVDSDGRGLDSFPGEPKAPEGFGFFAFQAGSHVVTYEPSAPIELRAPDQSLIAVLIEGDSGRSLGRGVFSVSPSGRYVAALDLRPLPSERAGAVVWIFDTTSGALLHRIATDPGYVAVGSATWHSDERHISLLRAQGSDVEVGRFALPALGDPRGR